MDFFTKTYESLSDKFFIVSFVLIYYSSYALNGLTTEWTE